MDYSLWCLKQIKLFNMMRNIGFSFDEAFMVLEIIQEFDLSDNGMESHL